MICAVTVAGVAALVVAFWRAGLAGAGAVAAVLIVVPLGGPLLAWARVGRYGSTAYAVIGDQAEKARRDLAEMIREQWRAESGARRLHDPYPVVVTWRLARSASADLSTRVPTGPRGRVGCADQLAELAGWFRGLGRRRLVILGDPGMGKTTLAVLLMLELLKQEPPDERWPVPVMFSLASFDPGRESLDDWLARRVGQEHPWLRSAHGRGLPETLVSRRLVLPVLDGLDEIPESARADVITALNSAMADGELGLILTCRTAEYAAAVNDGDILRSAVVIEPDPVGVRQAVSYLKSCIPPCQLPMWQPVLARMRTRTATPLAMAVTTPLTLWLVRQVYLDQGVDPARLDDRSAFPTARAIQQHLTDALIPALIKANPPDPAKPSRPRRRWDPDRAQSWLRYLACHLSQLETPDLAWWQLWQSIPPGGFGLGAGLAVGIGAGLGAALPAGPTPGPVVAGLVVGLTAGLTAGLSVGLVFARWRSGPAQAGQLCHGPRTSRVSGLFASALSAVLITAVGSGLTVGLAFGLSSWISTGPAAGLRAGLVPALAGTMAAGLAVGFAATRRTMPLPSRGVRLRPSISGLAAGFAAGLGTGLAVGLPYGFRYGISAGLAGGLSIGLAVALEGAPQATEAVNPRAVLRHDRRSASVVVLAVGLGVGVVFGLGFPLGTAICIGVSAGLGFAIVVTMLRAPWVSYLIARSWLALRGKLPWLLMGFLEDAHQLGVLRQVGTVYQFRHIDLQHRLADTTTPVWHEHKPPVPETSGPHLNDQSAPSVAGALGVHTTHS